MLASTLATPQSSPAAPRLRPGERPNWWNARADTRAFATWRKHALDTGLSVDVWVALLLELDLVLDDLALGRRSTADLAAMAEAAGNVLQLGPASPLRGWLGRVDAVVEDELPDLLLPERVAIRLTPGQPLADVVVPERISLALACDRRAALAGRTLESWALCQALRPR